MSNITISIVSHGHDEMVNALLSQLGRCTNGIQKVIITRNIPGNFDFHGNNFPFDLVLLENSLPLGFGRNHNKAFEYCETEYFCIMNPDIELKNNPFGLLLYPMIDKRLAITAPLIKDIKGFVEDSARYFPTPFLLLKKLFKVSDGKFPINANDEVIYPDWVGGMFMLVKANMFRMLSGFDEKYFLYYEDVDLCLRVWSKGFKVGLCTNAEVVHDARRDSHKNIKYMQWHIQSMIKFFVKHLWRFPKKSEDRFKLKGIKYK